MTEIEEKKEEKKLFAVHAIITEDQRTRYMAMIERDISDLESKIDNYDELVKQFVTSYFDLNSSYWMIAGKISGLTYANVISMSEETEYYHRLQNIFNRILEIKYDRYGGEPHDQF